MLPTDHDANKAKAVIARSYYRRLVKLHRPTNRYSNLALDSAAIWRKYV